MSWAFDARKSAYEGLPLSIISPSEWMSECARKSALLGGFPTTTVPNFLDPEVFAPTPKAEAKKALGIPEDCFVILFGAESAKERRKGFDLLLQSLKMLQNNPEMQRLIREKKILFWSFGEPSEEIKQLKIPYRTFGYVNDDARLSQIYSASNLVIIPSYQDNYPNLMIESLSCGTPVLAFSIGGMPDLISEDIGRLVPPYDTHALATAMMDFVSHPERTETMGLRAREVMMALGPRHRQAIEYQRVYLEALDRIKKAPPHQKAPANLLKGDASKPAEPYLT